MLFNRRTLFTGAAAIGGAMTLVAATSNAPPPSCPVTTQQSVFVPPHPFPAAPSSGYYYGTDQLWTQINDTVWRNLPYGPGGFRQKFAWWTVKDLKASPQTLAVSGKRLDGNETFYSAESNFARTPDMGNFIVSAANIPTAGCWEITGSLGQSG
jgi:hypothetical protein